MKHHSLALLVLATVLGSVSVGAQTQTQIVTRFVGVIATPDPTTKTALQTRFKTFSLAQLDHQTLAAALKSGRTRQHFSITNLIDEEVTVERRDLRAPNYRLFALDGAGLREVASEYVPNTYVLHNAAGQEIGRLNVDDKTFEARIEKDDGVYYVRQLTQFVTTRDTQLMVINKAGDEAQDDTDYCSSEERAIVRQALQADATMASSDAAATEKCLQLEIAAAGDYTLFRKHGIFGTQSRVFEVVNMAEHIYVSKFGMRFTVTGNVVSLTEDPYSSSDSGTLLDQFKEHWNALDVPIKRDIAILVSGKNLDGGTKGRAFIGVAGLPDRAYAVVQSPGTDHLDYVVAHEIGHSLDAQHDESGCVHLLAGNRWIMCPWVGTKNFSGNSRNSIVAYLNANIDLFISEFTLTTNPFYIDGNFTHGELHAGNSIITQDYFLQDPSSAVTLVARRKIVFKQQTRVTGGAKLHALIVPDLCCTAFGSE